MTTRKNNPISSKLDTLDSNIFTEDIFQENKKKPSLVKDVLSHDITALDDTFFSTFKKTASADSILHGPENMYSPEFVKLLAETLGPVKTFLKANKAERKKIQEKVDSLFYIENQYKHYHKKIEHTPRIIKTVLRKEFEKFNDNYNKMVASTSTNKKVGSKFYSFKILKFTESLMNYLKEDATLFTEEEKSLLNNALYVEVLSSILPIDIFMLLSSSAVKIAYQNLIENKYLHTGEEANETQSVSESSHLQLYKHELQLVLEKRLIRSFVSEIVIRLESSLRESSAKERLRILQEKIDSEYNNEGSDFSAELVAELPQDYLTNKLSSVIRFIKKDHLFIETLPVYDIYVSACHSLMDVFCASVPVRSTQRTKREGPGKITTQIVLEMPKGMNEVYSFSDHLPMITPPEDWDNYGCNDTKTLIKYIHIGTSDVTYDSRTIAAINKTQKKRFVINDLFVPLLESLDDAPLDYTAELKLPFDTKAEIDEKVKELELALLDLPISPLKNYLMYVILDKEKLDAASFKKKLPVRETWFLINATLDITDFEKVMHAKYMEIAQELKTMKAKKQIFYTMIVMAKVFKSFPLYFETFSDYRGRMYPLFYLFSRTTGFYKYLLKDYDKEELTVRGTVRMLEAYYSISKERTSQLKAFLSDIPGSSLKRELLHEYFMKNRLKQSEKSVNFLYFELLEQEILVLPSNKYKTNFVLEIDQKSSSSTFLSLLLGNKKMAKLSNLLGGEAQDINNYLQSKTREYILGETFLKGKSKGKEGLIRSRDQIEVDKVIDLFERERSLTKMAFMCFCYNQGAYGRALQWIDMTKKHELTEKEERVLWIFSHKYEDFLNECFANFEQQLNALKSCYEFFNEHSNETSIRTLDGSLLKWSFFLQKKTTGSRYNPIVDKTQNYKRSVPFTLLSSKKEIDAIKIKLLKIDRSKWTDLGPEEKTKLLSKQALLKKSHVTLMRAQHSLRKRKESAFRPGLVHSLDAAVIRLLINFMFDKHCYNINHLHDSIQCHPNYVDVLYEEIVEIYKHISTVNISALFTDQAERELSQEDLDVFRARVLKLEQLKETPVIDPDDINPENMYPFEK
jgi:hypothetical protein